MVEVKVYSGGSLATRRLDEDAFGTAVPRRTLKDAVVMYEANVRTGTAKTRTRGEVKGPNRKLWKQKHTGRARMGTTKAPQWRGGGVAFGPVPRDHGYQMPKKARRAALRGAVLSKLRDGELAVADGWPTGQPSTKAAAAILEALGLRGDSVLVVTESHDAIVYRSLRNVPRVDVRPVADLNAHQVLLRRHMVLTPAALELLQQQIGRRAGSGRRAATAPAEES